MKKTLQEILRSFVSSPRIDQIAVVAVNSRNVVPGALFFALPGKKTDGHLHLQEAVEKGAIGLVVAESYQGELPSNVLVVRVRDPLETLQRMAHEKLKRLGQKVVAITGSVGKTSTKEFVRELLAQEKKVFTPKGNQNSQIGLPCSLLNDMSGDEEWCILEMGMTHPGNIATLVQIAPPDIAAVVSIHYAHAENFSSLKEIAQAKAEIFSTPSTTSFIINRDALEFETLARGAYGQAQTFSLSGHQSARWTISRRDGQIIVYEDHSVACSLADPQFLAQHVYDNLLAAVSIARTVGVSWKSIAQKIPYLQLPQQRLEVVEVGAVTFLNDSYNASEPSMISALKALGEMASRKKSGRLIAVLGQMRGLGAFSQQCHRNVGDVAADIADYTLCYGQEAEPMYHICKERGTPCFWTVSSSDLKEELFSYIQEGDYILLKGSNSNELWALIDQYTTMLHGAHL